MLKNIFFIFVCFSFQTLSAQTFIKQTATGTASGADWDNALGAASLEATIEAGGTVYIAEGTYAPAATISISVNVVNLIQGGFPSSATGTDLTGYDPVSHPTIIDGGGTIRIFDNPSTVDNIHIKGLVIQHANAPFGAAFNSDITNGNPIDFTFTDLVVQNCITSDNGTWALTNKSDVDTEVSFVNCTFNNNTAGNGAGIYLKSVFNNSSGASAIPGKLFITNCSFKDNTTTLIGGGGIYLEASSAWTISNTEFCSNTATNARGGAIYSYNSGYNILDSCSFFENTTNEFGGGIFGSYAGLDISNSIFVGNESSSYGGGAIGGSNTSWQIANTNFYNNSAINGGAIYSTSWYNAARSTATNCIFSGNIASGAGTISGDNGGGAMCIGANTNNNGWDIDTCTFVNNQTSATSWGGAISHGESETSLANSLFYNNTKGGDASISGSDIKNYDNTGGFYSMAGNQMQLIDAAAYTNQTGGTDASSYAFTDDTFLNTDDGSVPAAPAGPCSETYDISGTIFEDINYGGGIGRTFTTAHTLAPGWSANDIGLAGVTVELYDNTGIFLTDTVTNIAGQYTFLNLPNGNYSIRVVNNTIVSNRGSNGTGEIIIPVQTFRTDGTTDVLNEVGGANPALIDTTANASSADLSTLSSATASVQSVTPVAVADTALVGVDFGFNFDVIVNTNDSGQGSLRQFILNSNELSNANLNQQNNPAGGQSFVKNAGWEVSVFMIPGTGVHIIQPLTQLPFVEDSHTIITGYTQDGSSQGPIATRTINVELIGNTTLFDGLTVSASDVGISGLAINSFKKAIYSNLSNAVNSFVWGNYIGTKADGLTIGANSNLGVHFYNINDSFLGTDGDGQNDANEGNLISGSYFGLEIRGTDNVLVAGNYVGTDKAGMLNLGNQFIGIHIRDAAGTNYIGFKDSATNSVVSDFRNISSGNGTDGIRITNGDNQIIAGNYLGTNALGTAPIGNNGYGIQYTGISNNTFIGTNSNGIHDSLEGNLIAGNGTGIRFASIGSGTNNTIAGNFIGTDYTGNAPLPNLNNGLSIIGSFSNNIIGTNGDNVQDALELNVISGNIDDGIRIDGSNGNIIAGNNIGVGANGSTAIGNGKRGIFIVTTSSDNIIGFGVGMVNTNELIIGNKIENNGDVGIGLSGTGTQNRISRNQFSNNDQLGIDLNYDLVTANDDGDTDSGVNTLLNFPVIDSVYLIGNDLTIRGFAPAGSEIEFYIADGGDNPDPIPGGYTSSFGEGSIFIDAAQEGGPSDVALFALGYTDDGTGSTVTKIENRFQFTFDVTGRGLSANTPISSLAIDAANNTSEFGNIKSIVVIPPCDAQAPVLTKN